MRTVDEAADELVGEQRFEAPAREGVGGAERAGRLSPRAERSLFGFFGPSERVGRGIRRLSGALRFAALADEKGTRTNEPTRPSPATTGTVYATERDATLRSAAVPACFEAPHETR